MQIRTLAALVLLVTAALPTLPAAAQSTSDAPLLIEQLECRGNATTSCAYILSYLYLSAGSEVDEEEIRNAKFRLSALPNFTSVRIFLEKGSARGKANVVVEVVEADPLFTETLVGLANNRASVLGFRIGHQNLFGAGERLELTASARIPVDSTVEREAQQLRLQYVDPKLFDSDRWFFTAGIGYFRNRFDSRFGDVFDTHETGIDFMVGRRLFDFSYLAVGYRYLVSGNYDFRIERLDGTTEVTANEYRNQFLLDYGWNSEDDPDFPTQGGRLRASLALILTDSRLVLDPRISREPQNQDGELLSRILLGYRHTWTFRGRNHIRFEWGVAPGTESSNSLDDDGGITLGYERTLGSLAGIERGRWYVDYKLLSWSAHQGHDTVEQGLKVGVRLDTRQFGIVELYLFGSTER